MATAIFTEQTTPAVGAAQKHVLIADDDRALGKALSLRCGELGLTACAATDGLEAYQRILQAPPDLLILDVDMPGANGLHMCEELSRDDRFAPIPVVILTGKSDPATISRCEQLGAHYIWKGLELWTQLKPLLKQLLGLAGEGPSGGSEVERTVSTVLIVDDDPHLSKALKVRLEPLGVQVLRAFSGMQGFWAALKNNPDVIITDYIMPDGRGNYLLGRLKEHPLTRDKPVIVITGRCSAGRPDHSLERDLLRLGACKYFTKPLNTPALIAELRNHIRMRG